MASLQIDDRVLIRNVGLKGRSKLADKWQDVAYVVKGQSKSDIPVFKVSPEGGGKEKVLHRNLLLPIYHVIENVSPKSKGKKMTPKPRGHFRFHLLLSLNVRPRMNRLMMS